MEVLRTLIPALVGALLFDRLGVPAGALVGAMVGAAAVDFFGSEAVATPVWLRFAALAVIGWEVGRSITPDRLDAVRGAILPMVAVVIGLLPSGAAIAFVLTRFGIDGPTAFLAASPGGVSPMWAPTRRWWSRSTTVHRAAARPLTPPAAAVSRSGSRPTAPS